MNSSEESDDSTNIFEVQRIIGSKRKADGTYVYKVQWEGYGREEDTWEPEDNLLTCHDIVDKYWAGQTQLDKDQSHVQATDQLMKKRGRPRRKRILVPSSSETEDETPQIQTQVSTGLPTGKRKRGRPRKYPPMIAGEEKPKRGRPRKKPMTEEPSRHDNETTCSDTAEEPEHIPLGMTRLASRELAHVRGKGSDSQDPSNAGMSDSHTTEMGDFDGKSHGIKPNNGNNDQIRREHFLVKNKPVVIELFSSSQETEHEDIVIEISSQESEQEKGKQIIVISSQSETEDDGNEADAKLSSLSSPLCKGVENASVGILQENNSSSLSTFQSTATLNYSEDSLLSKASTADSSTRGSIVGSSCNREYTKVQSLSRSKGPGILSRSGKVTEMYRRTTTNCAMISSSQGDEEGRKSPASLADWVQSKTFRDCCKSLFEGAGVCMNKSEDLTRKNWNGSALCKKESSVVRSKLCQKPTENEVDRLLMIETRRTDNEKVIENVNRETVVSVDDRATSQAEPNQGKTGNEVDEQHVRETGIDEANEQQVIETDMDVANEPETGIDEANEQRLIETGTNEAIEQQVIETGVDEAKEQEVIETNMDVANEPETGIDEANEPETGTYEAKERVIQTGINEANEQQVTETEMDEANEQEVIETDMDVANEPGTGSDEANEQRVIETGIDEANKQQIIETGMDEANEPETGTDEANEQRVIKTGINEDNEQQVLETGMDGAKEQQITETITVEKQADENQEDGKQRSKILSAQRTSKIVSNLQAIVSKIDLKSDLLLKPSVQNESLSVNESSSQKSEVGNIEKTIILCDTVKENFPTPDLVESPGMGSYVTDTQGAGLNFWKSGDKQTIPAAIKESNSSSCTNEPFPETKTTEQKKQSVFCQIDSWQTTRKNIEELQGKDFKSGNMLNTNCDEALLESGDELTSSPDLCESPCASTLQDESDNSPIQEQDILKKNSKCLPGSSESNKIQNIFSCSFTEKEREKLKEKKKTKQNQSTVNGNKHVAKPSIARPSHQVIDLIEERRPASPQSTAKPKSLATKPMDGDLLGSIMKQSGVDEEKKASTVTSPPKTLSNDLSSVIKDKATILLELENAPTPEASEDEEQLSDFEFELDDYSPTFFQEDVNKEKEAPPLTVSPMDVPFAALKLAVKEGHVLTVKRALAAGCDLEKPDGTSGMTLLMWAAAAGQDDIVKLLLLYGAEVNAKQKNGTSSLMHACEQGFAATAHSLLEADSHINAQQMSGETALMKACRKGHADVVELLLRHGADTNIRSNFAQTAKQFALRFQPIQVHNMLHDHDKRLASILEAALTKCLGSAGSLLTPPLVPYRCLAPEETEETSFKLSFNSDDLSEGSEIVLFCVKADFSQEDVCLSFSGDNGVRTVMLNDKVLMPVLHGNRSVFVLKPDVGSNGLRVQTYPAKCKLFVSVYTVNCNQGTKLNGQNTKSG